MSKLIEENAKNVSSSTREEEQIKPRKMTNLLKKLSFEILTNYRDCERRNVMFMYEMNSDFKHEFYILFNWEAIPISNLEVSDI